MQLAAADIHAALAGSWPPVLKQLGIDPKFLVNKHGPCPSPSCGGTDRYRFDDRGGRGTFYCNRCGAGDAFKLLQNVHGWSFAETRQRVIAAAGLVDSDRSRVPATSRPAPKPNVTATPAKPSGRVQRLLATATAPDGVEDAIDYLRSRRIWPLPIGCALKAHAGAEYWDRREGQAYCVGRYSALLGELRDVNGELVTVHISYLEHGRKLGIDGCPPRKLLGPVTGRRGCAIRLIPADGETLGVSEGVETALAAHLLHGLPVWAATNATLLARFEPPPHVHHVVIFADRDVAGLEAAIELTAHLEGRASVETRTPPAPAGDWADALLARRA